VAAKPVRRVPSLVCKLHEGCPAKEFEVDLGVHLLASEKVFAPGTTYTMTYNFEVKAAKLACDKVRSAEESAKHLASYRLEAGQRIRAAYVAGEKVGKTKAEVAKDIGFGERWVRELANADTPEKVFKAKAKKAATAKKLRRNQSALRSAGQQDCDREEVERLQREWLAQWRAERGAQWRAEQQAALKQQKKEIHSSDRTLLVKVLGMLGSNHSHEVLNAGTQAEKLRKRLGMSWDDLIVAAAAEDVARDERAAA
jgi:predicted transcriptional regulator